MILLLNKKYLIMSSLRDFAGGSIHFLCYNHDIPSGCYSDVD